MPREYSNSRRQSRSRRSGLMVGLLTLGCTFISQGALSDETVKAFYYDAKGQLLQVEAVPPQEMNGRNLLDPSDTTLTIPTLTSAQTPLITGADKPMSRFATIAVYYKSVFDQANPEDAVTTLFKVEDLQWVHERTLATCVPRSAGDPCYPPRRCHCVTQCCCY